jgi:hypothetical protein
MKLPAINISNHHIISLRGKRNQVDPATPYGFLTELERTHNGKVEPTGVIFLTNKECSFKCLMCDLWKNTTEERVPPGAIPSQIEFALERMPGIKHLKLYNSGSFFDTEEIPPEDYPRIASLCESLDTVIVESHPKLIGDKCLYFRDLLKPELEVAMGLETVNTEVLALLNKKMSLDDFSKATGFLSANKIRSRAFILLRPPFISEEEGLFWAKESVKFAFEAGVECCTVIPVRGGNGIMDYLAERGLFHPPSVKSLEKVLEYGIELKSGRVFADTWDLHLFSSCPNCFEKRRKRINEMNTLQTLLPPVECYCNDEPET